MVQRALRNSVTLPEQKRHRAGGRLQELPLVPPEIEPGQVPVGLLAGEDLEGLQGRPAAHDAHRRAQDARAVAGVDVARRPGAPP